MQGAGNHTGPMSGSHWQAVQQMSSLRLFTKPCRMLPDSISIELIRILIGGRAQIIVMMITVAVVAAFSVGARDGWLVLVLAAYIYVLLTQRYLLMGGVSRKGAARLLSSEESAAWFNLYRRLIIRYCVAIGAMNVVAVINGDWVTRLIIVAEIFGLCAGQVSRTSSRPKLCAVVVLTAALPTGLAFLAVAFATQELRAAAGAACIGLIIIGYAVSSLDVIAFNYRTILSHLEAKRHLAGIARVDDLTGLPNRLALREGLQAALVRSAGGKTTVALHLIDLDGFKRINDMHGHPVGDRLLRAVADRLTSNVRGDDIAYRLGGDEFAVIQHNVIGHDEIELLGRRLIRALSEPFIVQDSQLKIGASDGTATAPTDAEDCDALIECADEALYQSKAAGKGTVTSWLPPPLSGPLSIRV